jgi:CHC2 zinc finger
LRGFIFLHLADFYNNFYGFEFYRHFRRIPDFDISHRKFRIEYPITSPKKLAYLVSRNSGFHACFASVNSYQTSEYMKNRNKKGIVYNRLFFDFDIKNNQFEQTKKALQNLRKRGLNYMKKEQEKLKYQLLHLIIENKVAEMAIEEAKRFAKFLKKDFDQYPVLFFSGGKGCHIYIFFNEIILSNPDHTISNLAEMIKRNYRLETMDSVVNKDASVRLSRIPYSQHQLTGLTVIPFSVHHSYEEIIQRSIDPKIEKFELNHYQIQFDKILLKLDRTNHFHRYDKSQPKIRNADFRKLDHIKFFQEILGEPKLDYSNYVMYHCPFPDHPDNKPSFRVHLMGYACYGCQRRGNYWTFLKDINKWTDQQTKEYLQKNNNTNR